ncbi:hypothetical protein [Pseudomonas auratipiscis]|uniref:Uncharacterized protein n=1 Tax=Pseudomonas auratipiscis TaxID=3115853 RepID=A0AB35WQY5_9PSED|nr:MULTISPECIES: hypothetical protein [unclassified Pseudomonas]MEE1865535.1 hypothetical protein [Pseudomonas sp. 120P]MEE1956479.1 hypothetical protein [Pseudomonas sp. 119P]
MMKNIRTAWPHWLVIAIVMSASLAALFIELPRPFKNSQPYRTEGHNFMAQDVLDSKEGLTISEPSAVISVLERLGDKERHVAVGTSFVDVSRWRLKIKVEDLQASSHEELFDVRRNSELLFARQYFRLGSILNLAVIPSGGDTLCYYMLELDRLRCMND